MNTGTALLIAVVLLIFNGFFVAAEFALLAARRSKLEHAMDEGDRRARHAIAGIRQLSLMLAGAQLGITMASLGLGAVAEPAVAHLLEDLLGLAGVPEALTHAIAFAIALSIVVFFHMVVGEMAPKSWAIADPERSALLLAGPFRAFVSLFRPFIAALNGSANLAVRAVGVQPQDERAQAHSAAELALLLQQSAVEGTILQEQAALFERALRLSGLTAVDAMTPRSEIVAVPTSAGIEEVEAAAQESGRRRLVVFGDGLDDVRGVVHARDILLLDETGRHRATAGDLARSVLVTTAQSALEDLLLDMRSQRSRFAVAMADDGSVAGVVTLQRVLEALIGREHGGPADAQG
jgi:CBS domain containing-hemolysin-like protein